MRWLFLFCLALLLLGCLQSTPPASAGEIVKPYPLPQAPAEGSVKPTPPAVPVVAPAVPTPTPQPVEPAPESQPPAAAPEVLPAQPAELALPTSAEQCEKDERYSKDKPICYAALAGSLKDSFYCDKAFDAARTSIASLPEEEQRDFLEVFGFSKALCYADVALATSDPKKCDTLSTDLELECRNRYHARKAVETGSLANCSQVKPTQAFPNVLDACKVDVIRYALKDASQCAKLAAAPQAWCYLYVYADRMLETKERKPCYDIPLQPLPAHQDGAQGQPDTSAPVSYGRNLCLIQWMAAFGRDVYVCDEMKAQTSDFEACESAFKAPSP